MKTKEELQKQLNAIQKELDNFKEPKFKLNKWYKVDEEDRTLWFVNDIKDNYGVGYGLINGTWRENSETIAINSKNYTFIEATDQEVEETLIKEAKKRGFKSGVEFTPLFDNGTKYKASKISNGSLRLNGDGELVSGNNFRIFANGKWAEIIEDSKPKINGYEMEVVELNHIKFGCAEFDAFYIDNLLKQIDLFNSDKSSYKVNRKIKSITLDSGVEITVKQLKEVVDYLNK